MMPVTAGRAEADQAAAAVPSATQILPVAAGTAVRAHARRAMATRWRELTVVVCLYAGATLAGLVPPRLLGTIVTMVQRGTTAGRVDLLAGFIAAALIVQSVLIRFGALAGGKLGEALLAIFREDFIDGVLGLPLSVVERAGSGDLVTRSSRDVNELSVTARKGVPAMLTAALTVSLTVGAIALDNPLLVVPCLIVVPPVWAVSRWYLRRAPAGYLRESASWGVLTDSLAETVEGARTVEALRLGPVRRARADADIAACYAAERYTLRLRTFFLPAAEASYILPLAGVLAFGGYAYFHGWCTLGQVTAAALYARALVTPMDELIGWLDHLQTGTAALARLLGLADVPADRRPGSARPEDEQLSASQVSHAYIAGHDVLKQISLDVLPGERIAIVGPSGAGKSTLGRLLAGIHAPDLGQVTVGGVPLTELPLEDLRGQIALVTQEHHLFAGTIRDNITLGVPDAGDQAVSSALAAVDALGWVQVLADGLDTAVGAGGRALSAPQAQQIALARLVLANPHTLILDEATSLIDPRSARRLERSLSAVLDGRTVVAIAHRLHTAHDADRVIVMEDGQITESGAHRQLIEAQGPYAALWSSWHGDSSIPVHGTVENTDAGGRVGG
ncbi:MAG TPA: ABC transporter ATP-binding protein [Streptosporangiaceae bacterium]|nr:ABC transporter ATP-binding protein [Streptosporangiaceae bacterium]